MFKIQMTNGSVITAELVVEDSLGNVIYSNRDEDGRWYANAISHRHVVVCVRQNCISCNEPLRFQFPTSGTSYCDACAANVDYEESRGM